MSKREGKDATVKKPRKLSHRFALSEFPPPDPAPRFAITVELSTSVLTRVTAWGTPRGFVFGRTYTLSPKGRTWAHVQQTLPDGSQVEFKVRRIAPKKKPI